jgi:hypothetical protein
MQARAVNSPTEGALTKNVHYRAVETTATEVALPAEQ